MIKQNKRGMSISIVILVMVFLILSAACLIALKLRKDKLEYKIISLEKVYFIEEVLNYNINTLMEESAALTEEEFIMNFKQGLTKYKTTGEYLPYQLSQVEEQLTLDNVEIKDGKVFLTLNFKIDGDVDESVYASYTYTKTFEKDIPTQNI